MKLISVNIETSKHTKTVLEFLKRENADIVCLQELVEEEFPFYKEQLNLNGVFQPWIYISRSIIPELVGKRNGVAIFAKNITDSGSVFCTGNEANILKSFDEYMSNDDFRKNNVILWADIKDNNGIVYKIITTHFPVTKEGESTPYQIEVANNLINKLEDLGEFIICGDFNAPRGGETFSILEKKYKDNIPLEYKTSIDQNLHRVKGIQLMVDGLFTTGSYKATEVRLSDGVSDHMAIVAEISRS